MAAAGWGWATRAEFVAHPHPTPSGPATAVAFFAQIGPLDRFAPLAGRDQPHPANLFPLLVRHRLHRQTEAGDQAHLRQLGIGLGVLVDFARFLAALSLEISWEVIENSGFIIDRYRAETISLDYYGDSIINSVSDTLIAAIGFWLAYFLPVTAIVLLTIAMEIGVGYAIRDNLTLNIIMLLHPVPWIKAWQSAGQVR